MSVPSIDTPIQVFQTLETIQEKASGVTAAAQGLADNGAGDKVSIYEGNQAAVADRFGLLNKSYSFGYKRFAALYKNGVDEHLLKKTAVDIVGPEGVKVEYVSRRDIFRKNEDFGITVEASNAELALSEGEKKLKMEFLAAQAMAQPPVQNAQKAYEIAAGIAGFDDETIRQLQDTSEYGNASLMAKAERDIEMLLDGEKVEPNQAATIAYKQRIVDYLTNNQESLSMDEYRSIVAYAESLNDIIARNMVRHANDMLFKQQMEQASQPIQPEQPVSPMGAV